MPIGKRYNELEYRELYGKHLKCLTPREEYILRMRLDGYSLADIGQPIALTKERIRQLEAKAIRKLRRMAQNEKHAD